MKASDFYNDVYFRRQAPHGAIQAKANLFKFAGFVRPDSNLLDYGCGGGFLLAALKVKDRIGIEINPVAVAHANSIGISKVFTDTRPVPDAWADCVISNHALEHVEDPTKAMREFFRILKTGGNLVIVTPYDSVSTKYKEDDPDRHLFGWSPSNLGNLARVSGFDVIEATEIRHRWPPKWDLIWKYFGPSAFHFGSRIYGGLRRGRTQVRLVARKP